MRDWVISYFCVYKSDAVKAKDNINFMENKLETRQQVDVWQKSQILTLPLPMIIYMNYKHCDLDVEVEGEEGWHSIVL